MRRTSWTEISTWLACRSKWRWAYRVGIVPRREGLPKRVGSCGHVALASYLRGEEWPKAVDAWVTERVTAQALFLEEEEDCQAQGELVKQIMQRYIERYDDLRHFETVATELRFELKVPGAGVKLVGIIDALLRDKSGGLWVFEHKWPRSQLWTDEQLELDGQAEVYLWAADKLGYRRLVGAIYNQVLQRLPATPKINKNGSVSRVKIASDWPSYCRFVEERGLDPVDYLEMQDKLTTRFFSRFLLANSRVRVGNVVHDLAECVRDFGRKRVAVYGSHSRLVCNGCTYQDLCLEEVRGGDVRELIDNCYEPRRPSPFEEEEVNKHGTEETAG